MGPYFRVGIMKLLIIITLLFPFLAYSTIVYYSPEKGCHFWVCLPDSITEDERKEVCQKKIEPTYERHKAELIKPEIVFSEARKTLKRAKVKRFRAKSRAGTFFFEAKEKGTLKTAKFKRSRARLEQEVKQAERALSLALVSYREAKRDYEKQATKTYRVMDSYDKYCKGRYK